MEDYTAKHIEVLEGLEPVRKRPGMYIGSTGSEGLHHLIWEVVDNSIDEALAGYCKNIEIRILKENFIEVKDDGRGIPVDIHSKTKKSALETILTVLHSGGKFSNQVYKVSGGLHGVGVSVVNALSEKLIAEVERDGFIWRQEFSEGKPITKLKKIGKTKKTGTRIIFKPDKKIFKEIKFDLEKILSHIREQAFLTPGVRFYISDQREDKNKEYSFYFENGVKSFINYLSFFKKPIQKEIFYISQKEEEVLVEIGIVYIDSSDVLELAFTNNIKNSEGGTHLTGFRGGLTRAINDWAREKGFLKEKEENFSGEDVREGLLAIISVKIPNPQFEGQTKSKLGNPEIRSIVENIVQKNFKEFLEINSSDAKNIFNKVLLSYKARKAAKLAKENVLRKGAFSGFNLPGKLADCATKKKEEAEIFIVEGDSAGGSAKQARNRIFQAVFPLRGKILNVEKAKIDKILKSEEVKNLIIALGTNFGKDFNYEGLRYSKIIIATDADSITGDTPVFVYDKKNKKFTLIKVEDFFGKFNFKDFEILTYNQKKSNLQIKEILKVVKHPLRTPLYRIETINGYCITVTPFHSIYVYSKGKIVLKAGHKVKRGDYLILPLQLPKIEKEVFIKINSLSFKIDKDLAYILGFYLGTKFLRKSNDFYFLTKRLNKILKFQKYFKKVFKKDIGIKKRKSDYLVFFNLPLFNLILEKLGLLNKKHSEKFVPDLFFNVKTEIQKSFLRGIFDSSDSKIQSKDLVEGIIVILRQIKILPYIKILKDKNKIFYKVLINENQKKSKKEKKTFKKFVLLAIKSNKKIKSKEKWVYDFVVPVNQNFFAGSGGILLHNTDGSHIRTLLLTLFYRYFKPLIENGHIYIAQPPLYKIQVGKEVYYAYSDEEKENIIKEISKKKLHFEVQRYKGLGEMNPEELWETTMNPKKRVLKKVSIKDAEEADRYFSILMGQEVEPRKKFIEIHAPHAKNIDI